MVDFWTHSGWHLLTCSDGGELQITPDYLRAYFLRPEVIPEEGSCQAEINLHTAIVEDPMRSVAEGELEEISDEDVRFNYQVLMGFRNFLVDAGTLEAAYLRFIRGQETPQVPMLFIDQMVHAILRQILSDVDDPLQIRAAELFFREQNVSTDDGRIMLADEDTVDMVSQTGGMGGLGQLLAQNATPSRQVELDVLHEDNKQEYWARSDKFDTVIDFRFTQPALDAFARVIERWVSHFLRLKVRVQPVQRIDDENWRWHIGLDAEATRVLNGLYQGEEAKLDDHVKIIALFNMQIDDQTAVIEAVRGRPVYLGVAMTGAGKLRVKPQNLLVNMPLEAAG